MKYIVDPSLYSPLLLYHQFQKRVVATNELRPVYSTGNWCCYCGRGRVSSFICQDSDCGVGPDDEVHLLLLLFCRVDRVMHTQGRCIRQHYSPSYCTLRHGIGQQLYTGVWGNTCTQKYINCKPFCQ